MILDLSDDVLMNRLKETLVPGDQRDYSIGRFEDVNDHVNSLRVDFIGRPELCVAHAELIVQIRRSYHLESTLQVFFGLWATQAQFLCQHLDSRWLVSACDTFVDHGSIHQAGCALAAVSMINTLKLCETERMALQNQAHDSDKMAALSERVEAGRHTLLWDGMTCYNPRKGDMPRNLLERLFAYSDPEPALGVIVRTLVRRALLGDTALHRLAQLNPAFAPDSV